MGSYLFLHCRESRNQFSHLVPSASFFVEQAGMYALDGLVRSNKRNSPCESGERGNNSAMHHKPEKTCAQEKQSQSSYQSVLEIRERGKGNIGWTLHDYGPACLRNWEIAV